ncbi:MAG: hypothetical protein JXA67_12155 [Micromonosporaceae bacterium]|nr:hypothetical protein [Micromonosporaceae bacterium]
MSADEEPVSDEDLLLDIGQAVAALDRRFAAVEGALTAPAGGRRRRPYRSPRLASPSPVLRVRGRRRDEGLVWSVWSFDSLAPADRVVALRQLRDWVDWLNEAYELPLSTYAVPGCWYRHPGVTRELWALFGTYQQAHTTRGRDAERPTDAPALWHDRLLWSCLRRIREEHGMRECAAGQHTSRVRTPIRTDDGFQHTVEGLSEWNS